MSGFSTRYWQEWRLGVMVWLVGVAGAFAYLSAWPEKTGVNSFLMAAAAVVGICAMLDPFLHPLLVRRGLRRQ